MEILIVLLMFAILFIAYDIRKQFLFSINAANSKLHDIYLTNTDMAMEIKQLKRLIEVSTNQSAKELMTEDLKKTLGNFEKNKI